MALDSSSTLAQVKAAYDDNSDYDLADSVAKAKLFIQACRILLRRLPAEQGDRDQKLRIEPARIQEQLDNALAWLRGHPGFASGDGQTTLVDVSGFRRT